MRRGWAPEAKPEGQAREGAQVSVTMTGLFRRIFFLMAGERKIAPMTPMNGRHVLFGVTNDGFFEEVPDFVISYTNIGFFSIPPHISLTHQPMKVRILRGGRTVF